MPNCLTNWIGLKGCSTGLPESGIYINDLPGMSNEFLDSIATKDQVTFAGVWESVQRVVYEQVKAEIRQHLYDFGQVEMDQVIFQTNRINIFDRQVIQPSDPEAKYKGVFISAYGSKYLQANLKNLWVYNSGSSVTDVPFKVFRTFDWVVLFETTVDLEEGLNQISIDETFPVNFNGLNLFFGLDTTNVSTINNPFVQGDYTWGVSDCACANQGASHYNDWNYEGWNIWPAVMPLDVALPDTINFNFSQSGVYVDLDLLCSTESFICANKQHFKMGIAYALGEQLLLNKLAGFRQNFHATFNLEQTEKTMTWFKDMKDKQFKNWSRVVNVSGEDLCFSCAETMIVSKRAIYS